MFVVNDIWHGDSDPIFLNYLKLGLLLMKIFLLTSLSFEAELHKQAFFSGAMCRHKIENHNCLPCCLYCFWTKIKRF